MTSAMTTTEAMNTTTKNRKTENEMDNLEVVKYYNNFPIAVNASLLFLFFLTFLLNVLVGRALYKARRLKPVLRVLLFNLAVSDAVTGLVNFYHLTIASFTIFFSIECVIRYGLVIELMGVTLFFVVVLSVDRVAALVAALRYEVFVTTRRLWMLSVFIWIFCLIFPVAGLVGVDMEDKYCVFQLFLPTYSLTMYGVNCLTIIAFIVALNLFILKKTFGHIKDIATTVVGEGKAARVAAMNHRATVTSLFIVAPFIALCTPQYIVFLVLAGHPELRYTLRGLLMVSVGLGLVITNSLLNPFIYVWRSTEVRQEVKRFLWWC